jgi:hypothetical protein
MIGLFQFHRPAEQSREKPRKSGRQRDTGVVQKPDWHEAKHERAVVPEPVILVQNQQQDNQKPNKVFQSERAVTVCYRKSIALNAG